MSVDEYTLAAFLSGELPERQRKSVAAALVFDEEAREVLHMACEALAAAFRSDEARAEYMQKVRVAPATPGVSDQDRPAHYSPNRRVA
jgi:hypothetical protein